MIKWKITTGDEVEHIETIWNTSSDYNELQSRYAQANAKRVNRYRNKTTRLYKDEQCVLKLEGK